MRSMQLTLPLLLSGITLTAADAITLDASAFRFSDCEKPELVRRTGNLGTFDGKKTLFRNLGSFEYEFTVPETGWYTIEVPNADSTEFRIDGKMYGLRSGKLGNFYLSSGRHVLQLRKRNWFQPWGRVTKILIRPSKPELAERIHAEGIHFVHEAVIRKGGVFRLKLEAEAPKETLLEVLLSDRKNRTEAARVKLRLPAGKRYAGTLSLPGVKEGIFDVSFLTDGKPLSADALAKYTVCVIDTAPVNQTGEIGRKLIQTIDCAEREPDYYGGGKTRVVRKTFGAYRETGDVGWLTHMNASEPSWFAYKVEIPEAGKQYLAEIDYPDDAYRTYAIVFRNSGQTSYPAAGGVETGGEYPLSNRMRTHTLLCWAREKESRILIANAGDGHRGAASKIRIFELESRRLPACVPPSVKGRDFANWYEEGSGFVGLFGGDAKNKTASEFILTAGRWANTISHMGGNVLYPTLLVYQFGLNPSDYNPFATLATTDLAEIILLTAERYGMKVMFDFHPEARELGIRNPNQENKLRARDGQVSMRAPMHGPLHPRNRAWLRGMVSEFVNRYKHSPAFKGISIRHMTWYNHALNNFHDLNWGYDDCTVNRFEAETGRKVPGIAGKDDPSRFARRYEFLTSPEVKPEWIRWRCRKIAEIYRDLAGIVRQARPDLILRSDVFTKEGGVDPELLSKIPNVSLNDDFVYGRRGRGEDNRAAMLRKMLNPVPGLESFSSGASYFEATHRVFPPSQLGFPAATRQTWTSAVVNPPGRLALERFALAVARIDSQSLQDGGNAYTVGQPELRSFMRVYRTLPAKPFGIAAGADDPVAVRQNGRDAYLVNMLPFPVVCEVDGTKFPLDAYELKRFVSPGKIASVKVEVPLSELAVMSAQKTALEKAAAEQKEGKRFQELAEKCSKAFESGKYWRFRTMLDLASAELFRAGILLPDFHEEGLPMTPEGALPAEKLVSAGRVIPASAHIPDWNGEKIVAGAPLKFHINVPVVGNYRARFGYVSGGHFGNFEVRINGKMIGGAKSAGDAPSARMEQPAQAISTRDGSVEIELVPEAGKQAGISYFQLIPVYTPIPPMRWKVSRPYPKQDIRIPLEPETKRDFKNWTRLSGFQPFADISLGSPVRGGTIRYAVTYIKSPDRRKVRLLYGVDYWSLMWLNGKVLKSSPKRWKEGVPGRGEEFLDMTLDPGWNELLVKVASGSGGNGFWMEISNMEDLHFSHDPASAPAVRRVEIPEKGKTLASCDFERKTGQVKTALWDGSGKYAFTGKGALRTGSYFSGAKVEGGKTYALQVYAAAPRDGLKTQLQINWNGPKGLIRYDLITPAVTTEYSLKRLVRKAPPTATRAFLILGRNQKIWIDDMWFGEVPEHTKEIK